MQDYIRRFLIAGIIAICVGLLFLGVKYAQADTINVNDLTSNWMWPTDGVITDSYGTRNGEHKGIDIAAPFGSSIYAVDRGIVSKSYYSDTYGNVVFIKHDNQIETVYAHLQERTVLEGARVGQGEIIGKMGNTGDSHGVHLHFEVHVSEWTFDKKNAINPMLALGEVKVGQAVAAVQKDHPAHVIETAAQIDAQQSNGENNHVTREENKAAANESNFAVSGHLQTEYMVQKGDTLWSIANKHHSTVGLIQEQNRLQNNQIEVGQRIIVPTDRKLIYVVQKGDTLAEIAKRTNVSVAELASLNDLNGDLIKPQQELTLRK